MLSSIHMYCRINKLYFSLIFEISHPVKIKIVILWFKIGFTIILITRNIYCPIPENINMLFTISPRIINQLNSCKMKIIISLVNYIVAMFTPKSKDVDCKPWKSLNKQRFFSELPSLQLFTIGISFLFNRSSFLFLDRFLLVGRNITRFQVLHHLLDRSTVRRHLREVT